MELTNKTQRCIASISERKYRKKYGLFKCEGTKCVTDTIGFFDIYGIFATDTWIKSHTEALSGIPSDRIFPCKPSQIKYMSSLSTASDVIAVYYIPHYELDADDFKDKLTICLDGVQDPGNLGTIMRTADWFGIRDILCTENTADVFSPKVVQATMGAISRVRVHYCPLADIILRQTKDVNVYGTFLDGADIYTSELSPHGFIIFGNEGNGISSDIEKTVTHKITIPSGVQYGESGSESLNVATAAAITISEFFRRYHG